MKVCKGRDTRVESWRVKVEKPSLPCALGENLAVQLSERHVVGESVARGYM